MADGSSSWLDRLKPDFLREREGDFVKLEGNPKVFGPGPLLVLVGTPSNIDDDEVRDMLHDAAPVASGRGCTLYRIAPQTTNGDNAILDLPLQEALDRMVSSKDSDGDGASSSSESDLSEGPNGSSASAPVNRSAVSSSYRGALL